MKISSCPCAFLTSRHFKIFKTPDFVTLTELNKDVVIGWKLNGNLLLFFIKEHSLAKKSLIQFFLEAGYKMIIYEHKRYNHKLYLVGKIFKNTPIAFR